MGAGVAGAAIYCVGLGECGLGLVVVANHAAGNVIGRSRAVVAENRLVAGRAPAVALQAKVVAPCVSCQVFTRIYFDYTTAGIIGVTKVAVGIFPGLGAVCKEKALGQVIGRRFLFLVARAAGKSDAAVKVANHTIFLGGSGIDAAHLALSFRHVPRGGRDGGSDAAASDVAVRYAGVTGNAADLACTVVGVRDD
jgi:hypothetical protein